jgi:hypothetical protein
MTFGTKQFKLAALTAALLFAASAQASNEKTADIGSLNPMTGNTSAPSNWRFTIGQSFNGVVGALDGVARLASPMLTVTGHVRVLCWPVASTC